MFSKIDKENRQPIYLAISVGFSVVASAIYLAVIKQFEITYFCAIAAAILALNQTMYSIYENTKLRDLLHTIFGAIDAKIKTKKIKDTEDNNKESK